MGSEVPDPVEPISPVNPSAIPSDLSASPEEIIKGAKSDSFRASAGLRPWHDADMQGPGSPPQSSGAIPAQGAPPQAGMPTATTPYDAGQMTQRPPPDPVLDGVDVPTVEPVNPSAGQSVPTLKEADTFRGFWSILGNKLSVGLTEGIKGAERIAAGVVARPLYATGNKSAEEFGDSLFKTIDNAWDPGLKYTRTIQTANEKGGRVGKGAALIGNIVEGAAPLVMGPEAFVGQATMNTGTNAIDNNMDVKTAWALATAAGIANAAGMAIPMKSPTLLRRLAWGAGGNLVVTPASEYLSKEIMSMGGYQEAADKIDPLDPASLATSGIMGLIFGALAKPGVRKEFETRGGKVPDEHNPNPAESQDVPPVDAETQAAAESVINPKPPGEPPPPPPPPRGAPPGVAPNEPNAQNFDHAPGDPGYIEPTAPAAPQPESVAPEPGVAPAPVPEQRHLEVTVDQPSAESATDLHAQLLDAHDKKTSRVGVFFSRASLDSLAADQSTTSKDVRDTFKAAHAKKLTVKTPNGGYLVLPDRATALKAERELASGSDPQAVIGRITGAGDGKRLDQTVAVQGRTPQGAVARESMVTPEEVPAKVAEMQAEGKQPVVLTPDEVIARRAAEVQKAGEVAHEVPPVERAPKAGPKMGIAEIGKREVPVHIEEGAPEGMTRVRPLDEHGEPGTLTHDIPTAYVRTGEAVKPVEAAPKPVVEEPKPEPVVEQKTPELKTLDTALSGHIAAETPPPGRTRPGKLLERQSRTAEFARVLKAAAAKAGSTPEAARAIKAADAGIGMDQKGEEATNKGQGTGHARISAINEDMHKSARLLMGRGLPGDEVPAVAPKAAALKARVAKEAVAKENPAPEPKATSPAKLAEAEVRAKYPGVSPEEHPLARRMLKKRTAEIAAEQAAAEKKAKSEMVEAPVFPEVEKTVTDEQLRKARNEAKVDASQAEMSEHPEHIKRAERSQAIYDKLKRQHDIEHGVALEPDEPKTAAEQAKVADAAEEHNKLVDDYRRATDEEAPAIFEKIIASAENLARRRMTPEEVGSAKQVMDHDRASDAAAREQADGEGSITHRVHETIAQALKSSNPLSRQLAKMAKALRDNGIAKKYDDIRRSGSTVGAHELLDDMIRHAPEGMLRDSLVALRSRAPDVAVHPTAEVMDPKTGESSGFSGMMVRKFNFAEFMLRPDHPFTWETAVHEVVHAATAYEISNNPTGQLATELGIVHKEIIRRLGQAYGDKNIADHIAYFNDKGAEPAVYNRDLYAIASIKELLSETHINPSWQKMLIALDAKVPPVGPGPKTTLGRIARAIANWVGAQKAAPLFERVMDISDRIMEKQANDPTLKNTYDPKRPDGVSVSDYHASKLPGLYSRHIFKQAELALPRDRTELEPTADELAAEGEASIGEHREDREALGELGKPPPKLPQGDAALSRIMPDAAMEKIRSFSNLARAGTLRAIRNAKMSLTAGDQLVRRNRGAFGHPDDPKNPVVQLEDASDERGAIHREMMGKSVPISEARQKLDRDVDRRLGQMQIDATMWAIDPSLPKDQQAPLATSRRGFDARFDEFSRRWANMPKEAQNVFTAERDYNKWALNRYRRAGVDSALTAFDARDITPAQKSLLYTVRDPSQYDDLIGPGKLIDLGNSNEAVKSSLRAIAGASQISGYYAHLARHGEFVTQVAPEGSKAFPTQAEAQSFADRVNQLSPGSKAKVVSRGGKWVTDYKADYTSFHETKQDAEADAAHMRALGFDVGHVTQRTFGKDTVPMSAGMKELVAEATRKVNRDARGEGGATDEGSQAIVENLRSAYLRLMANRSALTASRLARKNVAGVKPEEMGRNFATHAASTAHSTAALVASFKEAAALGKVREAARDQHAPVSQKMMYRRGRFVEEIGKRMAQEARDYGIHVPGSAIMAKVGFLNFLTSAGHVAINLTQNFTTAIPLATKRYGARAVPAFARAMKTVSGPSFRKTVLGLLKPGKITSQDVLNATLEAIRRDPIHGKWARGENSPLEQLMNKGVVGGSFSHQLGAVALGESVFWNRVFDYARLPAHLSDVFNRVSTALAGLELTHGNVRAVKDLINETHIDYSSENMPRAFRTVRKIPIAGPSIVMFKTYMQGMAHLIYSQIRDSVMGDHYTKGNFIQRRAEAAKTVAALVLGTALFSGLKGSTPELVHLAAYAYNKIFGDKDKFWSFENAMHRVLGEMLGKTGGELAYAGLPHAVGIDVTNRMGFNELFFHNMPDLLTADTDTRNRFLVDQMGVLPGMAAQNVQGAMQKIGGGDLAGGLADMVPVKAFQAARSAFDIYGSGNTHEDGNLMIEPGNAYAAGLQAFGLKPSQIANMQERRGTEIEYSNFVRDRKAELAKEWLKTGDRSAVDEWNKKQKFSKDYVTAADRFKEIHKRNMAEQEVKGVPDRNPAVRELTDYGTD